MSDNKLVKTIMDAAVLNGLAAGIGWIAKKVVKENFTSDPSSGAMLYVKFTAVLAGSIALKDYVEDKKILPTSVEKKNIVIIPMPRSYFFLKGFSTVALLYFSMTISYYTADAIKFVWLDVIEDSDYEDSAIEDLGTEHFPLPDKCPPPPLYAN